MADMKWWGWGVEGVAFDHSDKPEFRPFVQDKIGIDVTETLTAPPQFGDLSLAAPALPDALRDTLVAAVGEEHVSSADETRVVHARGKSIRDIVLQRRGHFPRLPDVVVKPADEAEIEAVLRAVLDADAVLIPFGGGSSISGSLEPAADETRPVVSLDLVRLDRVLAVDEPSRLARVQAGVFGPALEEQLERRGFTLGHFPDSFTHSTLGGWIATRSSGMQSDRVGDVAEFTRAVRVVTPAGVLATRPVPSQSTGPSVREMVLGSEGRLGVITEATVEVHRVAAERVILGYLFPTFRAGLDAMTELAASECAPSVTRISDAPETQFSFATRKASSTVDGLKSKGLTTFLQRARGFDLGQMCLSFIGYEGSRKHVAEQRKAVGAIVGKHGAVCIGRSPGALYDQKKFDTPYIRDYLLDRGVLADVSETAAPWSQLGTVYDAGVTALRSTFDRLGVQGYAMCHLSHSYHAGACLYFTFAFKPSDPARDLEEYDAVKGALQQSFVDSGATLSHHHAVGLEHAPWLEEDISTAGVAMLRGLFAGVDPGGNLNPGKIA